MCVNIFLGGKGLSLAASHKEAVGRYTLSSCLLSGWRGGMDQWIQALSA